MSLRDFGDGFEAFDIAADRRAVGQDEGFRVRIARVFRNWTDEISALLAEAADRLEEDADPKRLARFIVATLEGATTMARIKRDVSVMHGVATDLKRFLAGHVRRPVAN